MTQIRAIRAILDVHGGPKTVYGTPFFHEMQLWANEGYFVFFCNPRGGDGKATSLPISGGKRYGVLDYNDLMEFTDLVLEKYPADRQKTGGYDRRQLWRLYGKLDCGTHRPICRSGFPALDLQLYQQVSDHRYRLLSQSFGSAVRPMDQPAGDVGAFSAQICRPLQDTDPLYPVG